MSFLISSVDRIFNGFFYRHADSFSSLQTNIRKAHINVPVNQYISRAFLYSAFASILALIICLISVIKIFDIIDTPDVNIGTGALSGWIELHMCELIAITAGIIAFILIFCIMFFLYISIPSFKASIYKSAIDRSLPHAVAYMYGLSRGGGMNLFDMFQSLSAYSHIYGATANEIGYIVRDMTYFGQDMLTALGNASTRTPSEKFKEFIDGIISIISSGGDITSYMSSKTEQYRLVAGVEQKLLIEKLAMLGEVYISIFVVGPLFLITILVVLGIIDPTTVNILYFVIYAAIPIGSVLFLVLLDTIVGESDKLDKTLITEKYLNVFTDVKIKPLSEHDIELIRKMQFYKKLSGFIDSLHHPFKVFSENPYKVYFLTIPLGLIVLLPVVYIQIVNMEFIQEGNLDLNDYYFSSINVEIATVLDDYIFFFLLITFTPFLIFYELKRRKISGIEDQIPEFIKKLASMNESGIILIDAIAMVARLKIGILHTEVKRMVQDMSWGTNLGDALQKFEYRIRTEMTARIITLIIKASESTSDIRVVLTIAASDANVQKQLKKERSSEMFMYVFIIYIAYFVFLFIIIILAVNFLSAIPSSTDDMAEGMTMVCEFDYDEYIMLFFHASMIQGFCSGLIAGKMGSGFTASGLKHSIVMMLIAYFVFTVII